MVHNVCIEDIAKHHISWIPRLDIKWEDYETTSWEYVDHYLSDNRYKLSYAI